HRAQTSADATAPLVLVLPEGCQVKDTEPGESLCFAAGAPPCHAAGLALHQGRGGAGLGTYYGHVLLVNRSARTCSVAGYPRAPAAHGCHFRTEWKSAPAPATSASAGSNDRSRPRGEGGRRTEAGSRSA